MRVARLEGGLTPGRRETVAIIAARERAALGSEADIAGQSIGVVPDFVNINASNGVIHVIDTVMLPFTL